MSETQLTKSEDYRSVYANVTKFNLTQWDIEMVFGSVKAVSNGEDGGSIEVHTGVTLSYAAAKTLLIYLTLNVQAFEAEHGCPVKIPAAALPPDICHLAAVPVADLITESSRIQHAKSIEMPTAAATVRPN